MKNEPNGTTVNTLDPELLRQKIREARAEADQTEEVARRAKVRLKKAKKAFKQARKTAKQSRKALKALVARQEEATALRRAKTARTAKIRRLVPRRAPPPPENAIAPAPVTSPVASVSSQEIALPADEPTS